MKLLFINKAYLRSNIVELLYIKVLNNTIIFIKLRYVYIPLFLFNAAFINPINKGCGLLGLDFNSGWN